jgi:hypothetical protein
MSLRDAVAQAGSFDALLPHLRGENGPPRIMARAAGFFTSEGVPKKREDNIIPAWWWDQLRAVDPAANRAWFEMAIMADVSQDILATGIEFEGSAVEALFPTRSSIMKLVKKVSAPTPQNVGGKPADHDWKGAKEHVNAYVAEHGPLPTKAAAVKLMQRWFLPPPKGPEKRTIEQWIQHNAPEEWFRKPE